MFASPGAFVCARLQQGTESALQSVDGWLEQQRAIARVLPWAAKRRAGAACGGKGGRPAAKRNSEAGQEEEEEDEEEDPQEPGETPASPLSPLEGAPLNFSPEREAAGDLEKRPLARS